MGAAACGEISEGGHPPLYPVKETARADIPLEGHMEETLTAACGGLHTGAVGYFPKEITPSETSHGSRFFS